MAIYKILYWQEIPTQIKAEDESDDVTVMLDGRFMAQVDILAARRGLQSADDYLAQWKWSEERSATAPRSKLQMLSRPNLKQRECRNCNV
jgi:hypothetical protein